MWSKSSVGGTVVNVLFMFFIQYNEGGVGGYCGFLINNQYDAFNPFP
jgi:hypothetical protein